jgi:hypothetical protein
MTAKANHNRASVSDTQLIRILADVLHQTWVRQKVRDRGARPEDLDPSATCRDLERAEDVVTKLKELGLIQFTDTRSTLDPYGA